MESLKNVLSAYDIESQDQWKAFILREDLTLLRRPKWIGETVLKRNISTVHLLN